MPTMLLISSRPPMAVFQVIRENDLAVRQDLLDDQRDTHLGTAGHDNGALPDARKDAEVRRHVDGRRDVIGHPLIAEAAGFGRGGVSPVPGRDRAAREDRSGDEP